MRNNGVHHITTSPYHPSLNGLAKRVIQMFKSGIKKLTEGTLETRLTRLIFHYRTTPHATTCHSPAELMLGRQLRTRLDLLKPDISKRVKHTRSGRSEHMMFIQSQESSSLGHRSTPRTLVKGCHGFLESFRSRRAPCLTLLSPKMVVPFADTWIM